MLHQKRKIEAIETTKCYWWDIDCATFLNIVFNNFFIMFYIREI